MSSDEKTYIDSSDGVPTGTQLNGIYEIDERIAMGGMGEVYRGHNIQTGDVVAIKIVLPEFAKDETILALFRKEASILNHLSHDAIVQYHVFTVDPGVGRPYLAMEFVDGQSLADRILEGPMELKEGRKMVAGVASGLQAAHDAGIVHRDLSPDNIILVEAKGKKKAKIIDFGIAKSSGVGGGTLLGGKFAGKYNFVSPEQLGLFEGEVTGRSDMYSLGLVAAAAFLGETLDMSGSQVDVIEKRRVVPDVTRIDPSVRPIVEAMLQPDPADRPEDMTAVVEWLFPPENSQVRNTKPPAIGSSQPELHQETIIASASTPPSSAVPQPSQAPISQPPVSQAPVSAPPASSLPPASMPPASLPPGGLTPQPGANPYDVAPQGLAGQPQNPDFVPHYSPPAPQLQPAAASVSSTKPAPAKSRGGIYTGIFLALLAAAGGGAWYTGMLDEYIGKTGPTGEQTGTPELTPAKDKNKDETETTSPEEKTVIVPEEKPITQPIDKAPIIVDWLNKYQGGPCFYAVALSVSENSMAIEGFAATVAPLEKLEAAFKAEHGFAPDIQARLIDTNQCAVAEFLQTNRASSMARPTLGLSSSNVKSGQSLSGEMGNIANGSVSLVLIDNEGVVYNLDSFIKKNGDKASFSIKLVDLETRDPLPQMILALSSRNGITTIRKAEPELASELLSRILDQIKSGELEVGAVVKYFKLGG